MTSPPNAMPAMNLTFHCLRRSEFGLLRRWLTEPLVARWWNHDTSRAAIERDFGAAVDGREPTTVFIADWEGRPFGLFQRYAVAAYPDYLAELAAVCQMPPGAVSVDYLIGEPDLRRKGLGARMIAAGVERIWNEQSDCADVIVPVHVGNRASWRALERAGFHRVTAGRLTPDNPDHSGDHYIYRAGRSAP
jgi:aminoglycoside 6'-N-acetyltransferase